MRLGIEEAEGNRPAYSGSQAAGKIANCLFDLNMLIRLLLELVKPRACLRLVGCSQRCAVFSQLKWSIESQAGFLVFVLRVLIE